MSEISPAYLSTDIKKTMKVTNGTGYPHYFGTFVSQNLGLMRRMSENLVIAKAREQAVSLIEFFWCA